MTAPTPFDSQPAHRHFSAVCFNRAWDFMDKASRTPEEADEMLHLAIASLWHWTQRTDCTETQRSVGCWQVSRVYALIGQGENARHYAHRCLSTCQAGSLAPFYLGYAYEALARAEKVAGNRQAMMEYARQARAIAGEVSEPDSKALLLADLQTLI